MPATPTADHNGAAIRDIRTLKGLSCAVLADRVGVHEQTLRNLELYDSATRPENPKRCSVVLIHRIATELGVSVPALVREPIGGERLHGHVDTA